jgi:hypothetical protein
MLFSLSKKFLFIANLKTASSSIEKVLAPHADLRLLQSQNGKHLSYMDFAEHFKWLLNRMDINELFVFGVIRDPVDYAVSIFNSHHKEHFRGSQKLYTGGMNFADFIAKWVPKNADQLRPQITRFTSVDGRLVTNFLIYFEKLQEGLEVVAKRLNVPELTDLPRENASPKKIKKDDLTPDQVAWVEARMQKDKDAIRRYADKLIGFS